MTGRMRVLLTLLGSAGYILAQTTTAAASQKPALVHALQDLDLRFSQLRLHTQDQNLIANLNRGSRSLAWLRIAASNWQPANAGDGRQLRESLAALIAAIPRAADPKLGEFVELAAADLQAKYEHCQQHGLTNRPKVQVIPKRGGVEEVKGLEVLYLEKFLQVVPNAQPHEFDGFSNPGATTSLVPGIYLFWARNPVDRSKAGTRKEAKVSRGQPAGPIEVLAP